MLNVKQSVRLFVICCLVFLGAVFLWKARQALYPFIIGLLIAYLLNPAVCAFEKRGLSRLWAIIFVYLTVFGALIWAGVRFLPLLMQELEHFRLELPDMVSKLEEFLQTLEWQYHNSSIPFAVRQATDEALVSLQKDAQDLITGIVGGMIALATHFIGLVISPVLAFYLLYDWYDMKRELLLLAPVRWRRELVMGMEDADKVLSGVIRGQSVIALIVGILVSAGLYLLGVRYALLIGIFAGVLDIIPYFGAFIGAAPAVALALFDSQAQALKVAGLFFVIHQLEGTIIGPKILGENVGLHPLSVIFFLFVGEEFGGLIGMLLGVPLAAMGKVFLRHLVRLLM